MIKMIANRLAIISLVIAMFLWGGSFVAFKVAFQYYDPMVVIFSRMFLATLCFLPVIRYIQQVGYQKGDFKSILFMAFCEPCLYFIFETKALQYTTASQAGMIASLMPLMVAILAGIVLKERISCQTFAGCFIAVAGACWLSMGGKSSVTAPNPPLGNFLEFLAMGCGAGYTLFLKRLTLKYHPVFLSGIQAVTGAIFFLPFLFLPSTTLPHRFEPAGVVAIAFLGIVITLGAYSLYNYGVSRIPANQAASFCNLIPVFTIFLGWLILDEQLTPSQYAASGLILAGVFLSHWSFEVAGYSSK